MNNFLHGFTSIFNLNAEMKIIETEVDLTKSVMQLTSEKFNRYFNKNFEQVIPQPDFRDLDNTPTKTTDTTEEVKNE